VDALEDAGAADSIGAAGGTSALATALGATVALALGTALAAALAEARADEAGTAALAAGGALGCAATGGVALRVSARSATTEKPLVDVGTQELHVVSRVWSSEMDGARAPP
jgi:hypothetical protein